MLKLMGMDMGPVLFRVIDGDRTIIEDDVDPNDPDRLPLLAKFVGGILILQTPCGNPDRCEAEWHDALLYYENKLWVRLDAVQNPLLPTPILVGGKYS